MAVAGSTGVYGGTVILSDDVMGGVEKMNKSGMGVDLGNTVSSIDSKVSSGRG